MTVEEWRLSDIAVAGVGCEPVSDARSSEGEAWYAGELGVGVGQKVSLGDQNNMNSAGGYQKERDAAVRKESAEMQENESCQHNDMEVDRDKGKELSFVPTAVSDGAGWHEPRFVCDRQCRKRRLRAPRHHGDRRWRAAHDKYRQRLTQFAAGRKKVTTVKKSSRSKRSACLEAKGLDNNMWRCSAAEQMCAKSLLSEAATALQLGKKLVNGVAVQRRISAAVEK